MSIWLQSIAADHEVGVGLWIVAGGTQKKGYQGMTIRGRLCSRRLVLIDDC